jgi:alkylated DNA repair dioxygenase AlkB
VFAFRLDPPAGQNMPRRKAPFILEVKQTGKGQHIIPLYRFPGMTFRKGNLPPFVDMASFEKKSAVLRVRELLFPHCNSMMATRYDNADDYINQHSDKDKDITPNTPIVDIILGPGAKRPFIYTPKDKPPVTIPTQHGTVIVMSYDANRAGTHEVPWLSKKAAAECGANNDRISLVMRSICTMWNVQAKKLVVGMKNDDD